MPVTVASRGSGACILAPGREALRQVEPSYRCHLCVHQLARTIPPSPGALSLLSPCLHSVNLCFVDCSQPARAHQAHFTMPQSQFSGQLGTPRRTAFLSGGGPVRPLSLCPPSPHIHTCDRGRSPCAGHPCTFHADDLSQEGSAISYVKEAVGLGVMGC